MFQCRHVPEPSQGSLPVSHLCQESPSGQGGRPGDACLGGDARREPQDHLPEGSRHGTRTTLGPRGFWQRLKGVGVGTKHPRRLRRCEAEDGDVPVCGQASPGCTG